ncbi:MAG: DUF4170 domain-containing protein [Parvibaculum sp.]|nr:DUF4170 domain-containing protein [Parvibaculum sp.]
MTKQLLHLVIGGELKDLNGTEFRDTNAIDMVGVFPDYASAHAAWKSAALRTVDNAHTRYFIVHLHRLMDPENEHAHDDAHDHDA